MHLNLTPFLFLLALPTTSLAKQNSKGRSWCNDGTPGNGECERTPGVFTYCCVTSNENFGVYQTQRLVLKQSLSDTNSWTCGAVIDSSGNREGFVACA
ncbi:hypothetical protein EJ03DRAFT_329357 [Teratosphaeria nubilosa]|uniref:Hydrophobin n=1 Tax=Teratosphaeria nubilosa TaxID=161662 RepID=A0A6G1L2P5_9PEZI|nr:hypothetical protein EJ03DRAFT_329357 [Teratosphaeria nubilosa]